MTNHVHLLVTPARPGSVSRMMQAIGRRYVGSFNARYRRTGTLWEGRFKAALVDTDRYLLTCYRYIELNPARVPMVEAPGEYHWSSYACNALGAHEARITPHACYLVLGAGAAARQLAFRELFGQPPPQDHSAELRAHTHSSAHGAATGSAPRSRYWPIAR